jgi:DNA-binding transcriptional MerR regulator
MTSASKWPTGFPIGELGRRTGCKVQTIRYYEQIGLMPTPDRTKDNQRLYGDTHADRLAFIRHSRELGFPLQAIRDPLELSDDPNRSCEPADFIARSQLRDVETRIAKLTKLKAELERMVAQCGHGRIADCNRANRFDTLS